MTEPFFAIPSPEVQLLIDAALREAVRDFPPLTETEEAYFAVKEDMFLWGSPIGVGHNTICEVLRGAIGLLDVKEGSLAEVAVWLMGEVRKEHGIPNPVGILKG